MTAMRRQLDERVHVLMRIWDNLTQPTSGVQQFEQRRQAQFLAALLVCIMPPVILFSLYIDLNGVVETSNASAGFSVTLLTMPVGVALYAISRTRYYRWSATAATLFSLFAVLAMVFSTPGRVDLDALYYLLFPIILASLFFSPRMAAVMVAVQIVVIMLLPFWRPDISHTEVIVPAIRFQVLCGMLLVLGARFRYTLMRDRSEMFSKTNEELERRVTERTEDHRRTAEQLAQLLLERARFEQALADERNLLRTVIDTTPDPVFAIDLAGRYLFSNQAHKQYFRDSLHGADTTLVGRTVLDALRDPQQAAAIAAEEAEIMRTGVPRYNLPQVEQFRGQPTRHYLVSKVPLTNSQGTIVGMVGIARDISEQKQAEQDLQTAYAQLEQRVGERTFELSTANTMLREEISERQAAEERLLYQASLLENVSDAIVSIDLKGIVRSWNRAAERVYGWSAAEAVGQPLIHLIGVTPEFSEIALGEAVESLVWKGEIVERTREGKELTMMTRRTLLRDSANRTTGMVIVSRDISDRILAQQAEHQQRKLAEALRDTAAAINSTFNLPQVFDLILLYIERVVPCNSSSIMLIDNEFAYVVHARGFRERAILQDDVLALRFRLTDFGNLQEMIGTKRPIVIRDTLDNPSWRQDEVTGWIRSYIGAPIVIDDEVIGFVNIDSSEPDVYDDQDAENLQAFVNQTAVAVHNARLFEALSTYAVELEQRVALRTAELRRESAQLQAVIDSMTEGVFGLLFDDKPVRYANAAFERLTGYTEDEWTFELMFATAAMESSSQPVGGPENVYRTLSEQGTWQYAGPIWRKDGSSFEAQVVVRRIDNLEGQSIGTVTVLRDVSQERALEEQQRLFVANASHELRTPITNLMTRLYLIRKQPELVEAHLEVVDVIARRMRTLVEDLLDHSRFERGVIPLEPRLIDLRDLIRQAVTMQEPEAVKRSILMSVLLPQEPLNAAVDPERFQQVVTNLLVNAIHYTPEGGQVEVTGFVDTSQSLDERMVVVRVQDSGIGIPSALLPHIFKPFFRVSEKTKGTGLGLSIAQSIVRAHDGEITVESQPERGSCFIVRLPILPMLKLPPNTV